MAVRLSALRTRRTLLPRNIIIFMFVVCDGMWNQELYMKIVKISLFFSPPTPLALPYQISEVC
jgi:hypothetical protein